MNLFWKKHTEPVPVVAVPDAEPATKAAVEASPKPSPADINKEVTKKYAQAARMSSAELEQVREQMRLSKLRLESIQKQIDGVQERVRQHRAYVDFKAHHDEVCADLYAKNKAVSALRDEEQRLTRFETCEAAMPLYLRLQVMEQWQQLSRQAAAGLKEQVRTAQVEADRRMAESETALNAFRDAMATMRAKEESIATGHRTDGQRLAMQAEMKSLGDMLAVCGETRVRYVALRGDVQARLDDVRRQLADNRSAFAPLNSNREAMEDMGQITVRLDNLKMLADKQDELSRMAAAAQLRQRDLNDRLSAMFERDQALEQQLSTLHAEVDMHRSMNHGLDGSELQMRVVDMRSRRQTLVAAASLWKNICELHEDVERKRRDARQLQHDIEQAETEIAKMEVDVSSMEAEAAQRRYDYTLSKGQNVIKMRGDLREGVACAVCGATTHPFHSDTILEQNKLISEWKSEADQLDMELHHAHQHLLEKQIKNATAHGILSAMTEDLERSVARYAEMIKAWGDYENVDASLRGCQPASMGDARTLTIRVLIENCIGEEAKAKERLDTYNYHQQAINRTQEDIDRIENERQELHSGLSETNTGCQVLASKAEQLQEEARKTQNSYQTLYETLDKVIDVADWHRKWQSSHDNFKSLLRKQAQEWMRLGQAIRDLENEEKHLVDTITQFDVSLSDLDQLLQAMERRRQDLSELDRQASNLYARLFGNSTSVQVYQRARGDVDDTMEAWIGATKKEREASDNFSRIDGRSDMAAQQDARMAEDVSAARGSLDDWMYKFRIAGNPPCRIDELHDLFNAGNDWKQIRDRIRTARQAYDLASIHENEVRTQLLTIEAGDAQQTATSSMESLVRQRREALLAIARHEQRLAAHEQALKQLEVL